MGPGAVDVVPPMDLPDPPVEAGRQQRVLVSHRHHGAHADSRVGGDRPHGGVAEAAGSSFEGMSTTVPVPPPTVDLSPAPELRHIPDRDRYELWSGDEIVGVEGYERRDDGTLVLLHTVVTEKYGRAGFARLLVSAVLDELNASGTKIVPVCTYVQKFLDRFPQYRSTVAAS